MSEEHEINTPETGFTDSFISHAYTPRNVGVITKPDGYGAPTGSCGDMIEIYLQMGPENRIEKAVFMSNGCANTVACASALTTLAQGLAVPEALSLTAEAVIDELGGLPLDHHHCARLAVSSLKLAIKDYLRNKEAAWKKPYRRSDG